jgi:hypothetical protein
MENKLARVIRTDREPGAGAKAGRGHDAEDGLGPFRGLLWGLLLSAWLWWVMWLAWRAL